MPRPGNPFAAAAVLLCLGAVCAAAELTCVVKTPSGRPAAGVYVSSPPNPYTEQQTAADGSFTVEVREGLVLFWHPDFRPLTRAVGADTTHLEVTLEDAAATRWNIPACSGLRHPGRRAGNRFLLPATKGLKVRYGRDIDYRDFHIGYGTGKLRHWLWGIEGPHATNGYPVLGDVLSSAEFTERSWRSGRFEGLDMRGRSREGVHWRYVGTFGTSISYRVNSADAAAFFDRLIAGACFEE